MICPDCGTMHKASDHCPPHRDFWYGSRARECIECGEGFVSNAPTKICPDCLAEFEAEGRERLAAARKDDDPLMNYAETVGGYDPGYWQ